MQTLSFNSRVGLKYNIKCLGITFSGAQMYYIYTHPSILVHSKCLNITKVAHTKESVHFLVNEYERENQILTLDQLV